MAELNVAVLYIEGCPNHGPAVETVRRVSARTGLDAAIDEIAVETPEEAKRLGFLGSPTVRVNGLDVEPAARARRDFGLSCRTYADGGAPSERDVEAAIREVAGEPPREPARRSFVGRIAGVLALFTSTGTLLCCALPAALAAVAGGAAVSSLVRAAPWLVPLSRHKGWIFLGSGVLIMASGVLAFRPKGRVACSITGGRGCEDAGRVARTMFWISAAIWALGAFFAYAIVPILRMLES